VDPTTDSPARVIDLGPLYERLGQDVPDLNIEGAAVSGSALWLLQRGNGASRFNATIELDLWDVIQTLNASASIEASALRSVTRVSVGEIDGVPLTFTDAIARPQGGLIFSAAAEDTTDAYADGPCAGSIIGVLEDDRVIQRVRVNPALKLEGIAFAGGGDPGPAIWLVADPDDREKRVSLYRAVLPFR
jgi:hypothetical protein